jgi:hypothetical protein
MATNIPNQETLQPMGKALEFAPDKYTMVPIQATKLPDIPFEAPDIAPVVSHISKIKEQVVINALAGFLGYYPSYGELQKCSLKTYSTRHDHTDLFYNDKFIGTIKEELEDYSWMIRFYPVVDTTPNPS